MLKARVMLRGFNPRLPGGRRLAPTYKLMLPVWVSIHAFRGEGDETPIWLNHAQPVFQSTPSGGKATPTPAEPRTMLRFQSTPSGGKATQPDGSAAVEVEVSIHAFRGEGDPPLVLRSVYVQAFQSTPSGGKAT